MPLSRILEGTRKGYQLKNGMKVSHLLFVDDLKLYGKNQTDVKRLSDTVYEFSSDIKMEFGLSKCASLTTKHGTVQNSEGINLPNSRINNGSILQVPRHHRG